MTRTSAFPPAIALIAASALAWTGLVAPMAAPARAAVGSWESVGGVFGGTATLTPLRSASCPFVSALASTDDTLYVGGCFDRVGTEDDSIPAANIAALNLQTGAWSALGPGVDDPVYALELTADDDTLYLGGSFQATEGASPVTLRNIAAWSGGAFHPMGNPSNPGLNSLVITLDHSNGDDTLYIGGGFFKTYDLSLTLNRLAAWSDDTWHRMGFGVNDQVNALLVDPVDDTVYLGGYFDGNCNGSASTCWWYTSSTYGGIRLKNAGQWADDTFTGLGIEELQNPVWVLSKPPTDDTIYAGGEFTASFDGSAPQNLYYAAQWGSGAFQPMGPIAAPGFNNSGLVYGMATDISDDTVYLGGNFTSTRTGLTTNRVATWSNNTFGALAPGLNGSVFSLERTGAYLFAGGTFTGEFGTALSLPRLARYQVNSIGSVAFDGNGATSGSVPSTMSGLTGTTSMVPGNTGSLALGGYSFAGWNTLPGGAGTTYAPGTTYAFTATDDTLYAQWSQVAPPTPPTPNPTYPPTPPREVAGVAGDASATFIWSEPASRGSFPISNYRLTLEPGGRTCLTTSSELSCTITGLTNGTAYVATVEALNGAGWSTPSTPSDPVTPAREMPPTIVITGARGTGETGSRGYVGVVYADGVTTQLKGERVQAHVHLAGETSYYRGSQRMVNEDEQFTWTRRTKKKVYVYFSARDGSVTSNKITVAP